MLYDFCMLPQEHKYSRNDAHFEWTCFSSHVLLADRLHQVPSWAHQELWKKWEAEATKGYNPVRICLSLTLCEPGNSNAPSHLSNFTHHIRNSLQILVWFLLPSHRSVCNLKHQFSHKLASHYCHFSTGEEVVCSRSQICFKAQVTTVWVKFTLLFFLPFSWELRFLSLTISIGILAIGRGWYKGHVHFFHTDFSAPPRRFEVKMHTPER